MFTETIVGRKSSYKGCGKDLADGYENIMKFFNRLHEETLEILGNMKDDDLKHNCFTPAGTEINIAKWMQLLAEHEIHHRGELYIYLNLLDIKTPPMYGLTAEELAEKGI